MEGGLALDYATSAMSVPKRPCGRRGQQTAHGHDAAVGRARPATAAARCVRDRARARARRIAADNPQSGTPGLRRLTRFEYGNAIRDLLSLQADVGTLLPPDNNSDGFDTNGDTLGNSPSLVEAYVNAASKLARRAVGDRHIALKQVDYRPPVGWSQRTRLDGMPFNSRGGFSFEREFPLDGEYSSS